MSILRKLYTREKERTRTIGMIMGMLTNVRIADTTISLSKETGMKSEEREAKISELSDSYKCDVIDFVVLDTSGDADFDAFPLSWSGIFELSQYPSRCFIYEGDKLPSILYKLIDGKNLINDKEMMTSMMMSEMYEGNDVITSSDLMWYMMADEGKGWGGHTALSTLRELEGDRFVVTVDLELLKYESKRDLKRAAMDAILSVSNVPI